MKQVLFVEDSIECQFLVRKALQGSYDVVSAFSLREAKANLERNAFDLILVDIELPDGSGLDLLQNDESTPILLVSGRSGIEDQIAGFERGALDYITKPFDARLLRARVDARIRERAIHPKVTPTVKEYGTIRLNSDGQEVFIRKGDSDWGRLDFTSLQFRLFKFLLDHPGEVFTRKVLIDRFWGSNVKVSFRTVDVHVSKIRSKIKSSGIRIQSVYGGGYRLIPGDVSNEEIPVIDSVVVSSETAV